MIGLVDRDDWPPETAEAQLLEMMESLLGLTPGAMTPLALMRDTEGLVTCLLDVSLLEAEQVNVHPLVQTRSIGLQPSQALTFLEACNHAPLLLPDAGDPI